MVRRQPEELADGWVPAGRQFTDPAHSRADLQHLCRIASNLWWWTHEWRAGEESFRVGGELGNRNWQHVVARGAALRGARPVVVVGFCGLQRPDAPSEELGRADEEMIEQFSSQPSLLSYSTWPRRSERFDNLICFHAAQGLDDWRDNEVHARWVRLLAQRSYDCIRLHRGEAPDGLVPAGRLRLIQTGYYHYAEDPPWLGVRRYPEGLVGEDVDAPA